MRRDIVELIPGADCRTMKMLLEYRQLGLLFTYNIDKRPQFFYNNQIVSSLLMLESVADTILMAFSIGILVNSRSMELKDTIDAACSIETTGDELGWMSRCVSKAIITGINSVDFIRDVSSFVPIKQTDWKSSYKMTKETSRFTQFANSRATYILELLDSSKQKMNKLVSFQGDDILLHMTNVAVDVSKKTIEQAIHKIIAPEKQLHRELSSLYNSVTSKSRSDLQQYVDCIRDLAQLSAHSSQVFDDDGQTATLQNIAVELISKSGVGNITGADLIRSYAHEITIAATAIEIGNVITKFADFLCGMMNVFCQKSKADSSVCDDGQMLKATSEVLTSAWSEIIHGMLLNRIAQSVIFYIQAKMEEVFTSVKKRLIFWSDAYFPDSIIHSKQRKPLPDLSSRLKEYNNQMKKSRDPHVPSMIDARILSKYLACNIIILDVDKEPIITISSPDIRDSIELIYNPPCPTYPGGHFDAYVGGMVVPAPSSVSDDRDMVYSPAYGSQNDDDYNRLCSAIKVAMGEQSDEWKLQQTIDKYIKEHPFDAEMLLTRDAYACQLKRERAILRFDMNHPTRHMDHNACDYMHLFSCIKQACNSANKRISDLAMILKEYESEYETDIMTASVSRDACKLFLSSGVSVEADGYRQIVAERINDSDITTALKLCCIGHQIPLCRDMIYIVPPISDAQTLKYSTFERLMEIESYKQERYKFLSICDEWYRVLEPQGLMNFEQRELLREWISTRQYVNTEDPVVSLVIQKCSKLDCISVYSTLGNISF